MKQELTGEPSGTRAVAVTGTAENAKEGIFDERARGPAASLCGRKKTHGGGVMRVCGIDQRD